MSVIDTLIYDRTQADVAALEALYAKALGGDITDEEWAALNDPTHKGAYNHTDLTRVDGAAEYLAAEALALLNRLSDYLAEHDVNPDSIFQLPYNAEDVSVTAPQNWAEGDIPMPDKLAAYLQNVCILRRLLPLPEGVPELPGSMEDLTISGANAIEENLLEVNTALIKAEAEKKDTVNRTVAAFIYSGEVFAGEV